MNNYTNLEISKLIASKVPMLPCRMSWWVRDADRKGYTFYYSNTPIQSEIDDGTFIPAYRLDDVLKCVKVYGEKMGWEDCICEQCRSVFPEYHNGCVRCGKHIGPDPSYTYHMHRLLTAFLADGCQFGPTSERVIRSIFE